jgi:squalene-associated FAD-dependent desaturase
MAHKVFIAGGGLAGMAAAAALGGAGFEVDLFETRAFLGGRATSYKLGDETVDNCQHILLRCCVNLLDFYSRIGVSDRIRFHRDFYFIEPGGRTSLFRRGVLPAPFHFAGAFAGLRFLGPADKLAVARALAAMLRERRSRKDLDRITMLDWLREKGQTARAIERFWRQVLVSAVNEDLERMAAVHGFKVFWLGFLAGSDTYEMGTPTVPLGELYSADALGRTGNVRVHLRAPVERIDECGLTVSGERLTADGYICALPFERLASVGLPAPELEHSPITGIHLWFDREITTLPHATLLDRTIQWMFNKDAGRYLQLVVSASRDLTPLSRQEVIDLALADLRLYFPRAAEAQLLKAQVVKEQRATFSATPKAEALRPSPGATALPNVFLAGDWTRTGWPATMEGAVRSGYLAAEAAAKALGSPQRFAIADIA